MGLIDKAATAAVKTSSGIIHGSASLVKTGSQTALNMLVNYTPDIYDKHHDLSSGVAKFGAGNAVMVARNAVRVERSAHSAVVAARVQNSKRRIKKKIKQIDYEKDKLTSYQRYYADISNLPEQSSIKKGGITQSYLNDKMTHHKRTMMDMEFKKNKLEIKKSVLSRKKRKLQAKGFKPFKSFKRTIGNQTRRGSSTLMHKDDMGSIAVGTTLKSGWFGLKFAKRSISIATRIAGFISSIIGSLIGLLTSIPAMIATIIASLPLLLVLIIVIAIISPFVSTTFSGRIGVLSEKLSELNKIYEVSVEPGEILAITDVLEWTTPSSENYEQIFSIMLNQKKGNNLSFEEMAENVFITYYPANKYELSGKYDDKMKTGIQYWSREGFDLNIAIGESVKRNLWYSELMEIYPGCKRAGDELKVKMKTESYQKNLIKKAKERISVNQERYEDFVFQNQLGDIEFEVTEDNALGVKIAKKALTKLGCSYIWGAGHGSEYKQPNLKEFDCSGLVNWAFYQSGKNIGDQTTSTLIKMGKEIQKKNLQPGDILLFNTIGNDVSHVGIYIGDNKMVHAPNVLDVVKVSDIDTNYWEACLLSYRRLY